MEVMGVETPKVTKIEDILSGSSIIKSHQNRGYNPYTGVVNPVYGEEFVGREAEITTAIKMLRTSQAIGNRMPFLPLLTS